MSIWFTEELHPYYRKGVRVKRVLADEQTQYQHLQFVETEFFGNAMISAEAEEWRQLRLHALEALAERGIGAERQE